MKDGLNCNWGHKCLSFLSKEWFQKSTETEGVSYCNATQFKWAGCSSRQWFNPNFATRACHQDTSPRCHRRHCCCCCQPWEQWGAGTHDQRGWGVWRRRLFQEVQSQLPQPLPFSVTWAQPGAAPLQFRGWAGPAWLWPRVWRTQHLFVRASVSLPLASKEPPFSHHTVRQTGNPTRPRWV